MATFVILMIKEELNDQLSDQMLARESLTFDPLWG
jgi:hypothetical protein